MEDNNRMVNLRRVQLFGFSEQLLQMGKPMTPVEQAYIDTIKALNAKAKGKDKD